MPVTFGPPQAAITIRHSAIRHTIDVIVMIRVFRFNFYAHFLKQYRVSIISASFYVLCFSYRLSLSMSCSAMIDTMAKTATISRSTPQQSHTLEGMDS